MDINQIINAILLFFIVAKITRQSPLFRDLTQFNSVSVQESTGSIPLGLTGHAEEEIKPYEADLPVGAKSMVKLNLTKIS